MHRSRRLIVCLAGIPALALASGRAPAAESTDGSRAEEVFRALEAALASKAEARGERRKAVEEWVEALERCARGPAAEVLLRRIEEFHPYGVEPRGAASAYARLLRARPAIGGRARELLTDRLARRYRAARSFGRAAAVEREMGYVNRWAIAGPFGYTRWSVHDQVFPPEREIDFEKSMRAGHRPVAWRLVEAPLSGRRVDLFAPLWPKEGCAYALAQVRSKTEREAVLVIGSAGSCKAWWNGSRVVDANRGLRHTRREHARRVRLRRGWNRLLVKVTSEDSIVSCRLADGAGLALERLEWEGRLELHAAGKRRARRARGVRGGDSAERVELGAGPALKTFLKEPDLSKDREALLRAAVGIVARADGRLEEALAELERAVELAPSRPHLRYQLALAAEGAEILPPSMRRTLAQEAYERAASAPGGFVPAEEAAARRLRADRHPERAIARLKAAISRLSAGEGSPRADNPHLKLALAEIALGEEWVHEARRWAEDAERAGPRWRPVHAFWGKFHLVRGNVPRAVASYREAVALDAADIISREALARIYINQGRFGAAVAELRAGLEADPGRLAGYLELARAEIEAGEVNNRRYADAENTLRAALRLSPSSPTVRRRLGELYLKQDKVERALAEWDAALGLFPAWHDLRREVCALRGEPDDFTSPFVVDVAKAIAESKGPDDYPRSDVILVVDQTVCRIYEDGSYSEITHQAQKALTTDGAEELSHIRVDGELIEARTHLPDGTVLEPVILPGRDTLTMPGVQIGSVVEHKYRSDHPAPRGGFVTLPRWYFRSLDTPHQFSDYVVIAPKSMDLSVIVNNWGKKFPEEKLTKRPPVEEGGRRIYRWISRNTRPLDPASGHDHMSTLLPHVLVGRARNWQDMNWEILDLFLGRTRMTRALERQAAAALESLRGAGGSGRDGQPDRDAALARTRALFRRVNDIVKADAQLYEANHVLLSRAGNRAILLAALLRAAGLEANFAVARPRPEAISPDEGPGEPTWALPAPSLFRDTLVCVTLPGGEKLWLDPDGAYSPFGATAPRFQGGIAYAVSRRGGLLTKLPWGRIPEHGETTRTDIAFDPATGGWRGRVEFTRFGAVAGALKKRFAESSSSWRKRWAEKHLADRLRGSSTGARLQGIEAPALKDPEAPWRVRASFVMDEALDGPGPWRELPTCLKALGMSKRFVLHASRQHPQKISSPLVRRDEVEITVPGVEAWAPPESHAEQTSFGSYSLAFTWEGETLTLRRSVTVMPQVVPTATYEEFVRFCRSVDAAEAAPLRAKFPTTKAAADESR